MAIQLKLDTVQGAELDVEIYNGRIIRTGLLTGIDLPATLPDPTALVRSLEADGMPQKGDPFPADGYEKYYCKRHIIRSVTAGIYIITIVYEYLGLLTITDSSSLSAAPTQLHPKDFSPLYVNWNGIQKLLTMTAQVPLRHITITQTVDFEASEDVLFAFKTVNKYTWYGLPVGYWLMSGLEGMTQDDGITYTYTAVFSTKTTEDWSQLGFIQDDSGHNVYVPPASVEVLRANVYAYEQDNSVNGILKVGMFDLSDFETVFGVGG